MKIRYSIGDVVLVKLSYGKEIVATINYITTRDKYCAPTEKPAKDDIVWYSEVNGKFGLEIKGYFTYFTEDQIVRYATAKDVINTLNTSQKKEIYEIFMYGGSEAAIAQLSKITKIRKAQLIIESLDELMHIDINKLDQNAEYKTYTISLKGEDGNTITRNLTQEQAVFLKDIIDDLNTGCQHVNVAMCEVEQTYPIYIVPCTKNGKRYKKSISGSYVSREEYIKCISEEGNIVKDNWGKYQKYFANYNDAQIFVYGKIINNDDFLSNKINFN